MKIKKFQEASRTMRDAIDDIWHAMNLLRGVGMDRLADRLSQDRAELLVAMEIMNECWGDAINESVANARQASSSLLSAILLSVTEKEDKS